LLRSRHRFNRAEVRRSRRIADEAPEPRQLALHRHKQEAHQIAPQEERVTRRKAREEQALPGARPAFAMGIAERGACRVEAVLGLG